MTKIKKIKISERRYRQLAKNVHTERYGITSLNFDNLTKISINEFLNKKVEEFIVESENTTNDNNFINEIESASSSDNLSSANIFDTDILSNPITFETNYEENSIDLILSDQSFNENQIPCLKKEDSKNNDHKFLKKWAISNKIKRKPIRQLLKWLHSKIPDIPICTYKLLGTPRNKAYGKTIGNGKYVHFGLKHIADELYDKLNLHSKAINGEVVFHCVTHIDGISFSSSSHLTGWTILVDIFELRAIIKPILLGVYSGYHQPNDFDAFLEDMCKDFCQSQHGFKIKDLTVVLKFKCCICDTPARCKCTQTMNCNAKYGCPFCAQKGSRPKNSKSTQFARKIVYPLRTNDMFRNRTSISHHQPSHHDTKGMFEKCDINVDMIMAFPIDIMHIGDLGATKKKIGIILKGGDKYGVRISKATIKSINNDYKKFASQKPLEFVRAARDMEENSKYFKATECRGIANYYGIVIFKHLPKPMYEHFLKYCLAVRLFQSKQITQWHLDTGDELLKSYVNDFRKFYGHHVSYVIHVLLHLKDFVEQYGPLYEFSAYRFENRLRFIKDDIRLKRNAVQQLFNRCAERGLIEFSETTVSGLTYPAKSNKYKYFMGYDFQNYSFKVDDINCFASVKTHNNEQEMPVKIIGFFSQNNVHYLAYESLENTKENYFTLDLNEKQLKSIDFEILVCKKPSPTTVQHCAVSCVVKKYVVFEENDSYILIPMLHNLDE